MTTLTSSSPDLVPDSDGTRAMLAGLDGRRRLTDRVMTALIIISFGVALIPLVSVSWTVVSKGIERFNLNFLSVSMRGVYAGWMPAASTTRSWARSRSPRSPR